MDGERFEAEMRYQVSLAIAESLLRSALLSEAEFSRARELLLRMHSPPIGTLLAEAG